MKHGSASNGEGSRPSADWAAHFYAQSGGGVFARLMDGAPVPVLLAQVAPAQEITSIAVAIFVVVYVIKELVPLLKRNGSGAKSPSQEIQELRSDIRVLDQSVKGLDKTIDRGALEVKDRLTLLVDIIGGLRSDVPRR